MDIGPALAKHPLTPVRISSLRGTVGSQSFPFFRQTLGSQGYCGATVRDIVRAADVPQGSFTNHFESKEAFCLELLIRYFAMVQENITKTLRNDSLKPLSRLRQWFDIQFDFLKQADFRDGCLIGNFSAEVGADSDTIQAKLVEMYTEIHESVVYCLKAAVKSGELPATVDCKEPFCKPRSSEALSHSSGSSRSLFQRFFGSEAAVSGSRTNPMMARLAPHARSTGDC